MNNSNDDDMADVDGEEASFDDFETKQNTLGDLWRSNPLVKIGVIVGSVALVLAVIFIFGGRKEPVDPSFVPAGAEVKAAPGTEETSPAYIAAVEEESEARIEDAFKEGGSALPTPIDPPLGALETTPEQAEEEDPLQRWRKLQEERLQRELDRTQTVEDAPELDNSAQTQATQAMAEVMSEQMQAILESKSAEMHLKSMALTDVSFLEQLQQKTEAEKNAQNQPTQAAPEILVPAGQIAYAQLLTEANSDVPGPVLAQIVSGPLKGSRILGTFEVQEELLTLTFKTVVIDGVSQSINAIALDPNTTLAGMATEVDHRYFKRIILPAAAAFIEGTAQAIAESGLTTITIEGDVVTSEQEETDQGQEISAGVEEAGQELRELLDEEADDTEILVRVASGTPMGVLFLESVLKPGNEFLAQPAQPSPGLPIPAGLLPEAISKAIGAPEAAKP